MAYGRSESSRTWFDIGFYVLMGIMGIVVAVVSIMSAIEERDRLAQEIREGLRLATGEPIIRDQITGCEYIKNNSANSAFGGSGYVLTPRYAPDGTTVMGCGKK